MHGIIRGLRWCLVLSLPLLAPCPLHAGPDEEEAPRSREASEKPLGYTSPGFVEQGDSRDFAPFEDRWRLGFPRWQRYGKPGSPPEGEYPYTARDDLGGLQILDPFNQNVLKADYPLFTIDHYPAMHLQLGWPPAHIEPEPGHIFFDLTLQSDSILEVRSFPVPSGISTDRPRDEEFFGDFDQLFFTQSLVSSVELFRGDAAFKPKDWVLKATAVFNYNHANLGENGLININVANDTDRTDAHVGMQELFAEYHLFDVSEYYDFIAIIAGIQPFNSDFRGFLFFDNNLGIRLQGNYASNRIQWNLAWFNQLEKDTNSGLNSFESRDQNIFLANLYIQDFIWLGYNFQVSAHFNKDDADTHFDDNGFLTRPSPIGSVAGALGNINTKELDVYYLGLAGEGHIGPLNISHQYYFAFGRDQFNEIAGRPQNINAHFGAIEASVDLDWLRLKTSFLYATGDKNPSNKTAAGFDSILDNPFFAGSGFSYFNRQNIPFVQTGVQLVQRLSLLPSLRSSKIEGHSNFVNPGLLLYNVGASARVTPKLFMDLNLSYMRFAQTETMEFLQQQDGISRDLGFDLSLGIQYRPLLSENIIITVSGAGLIPGAGFREIYTDQSLYSAFTAITFTY